MTVHLDLMPILAIAAGVAVLIAPKYQRYIVGGFLIVFGVIQILQ